MLAPGSYLRPYDRVDGGARQCADSPASLGFRDIETRSPCGARSGAPPRDSPALAARTSSPTLPMQSGQRLSTKLAASGKSPAEAFGSLRFFDDRPRRNAAAGKMLAFTQDRLLGSFSSAESSSNRAFLRNRKTTEIIVIHEFLHTLGLGENPPTSQAITERVHMRCGD